MQEFPEVEATFGIDDQFLLGSAILIKPVTEQGQKSVSVYLPPSSNWYNYETFASVAANSDHRIEVDTTSLGSFPVFLRGGSIVPRKDRIRRSSTLTVNDPYSLYVALDGKVFIFLNLTV